MDRYVMQKVDMFSERSHVCKECAYIFLIKMRLVTQYVDHTKKKAYHCEMCDQSFSNFVGICIHKKKVHDKILLLDGTQEEYRKLGLLLRTTIK